MNKDKSWGPERGEQFSIAEHLYVPGVIFLFYQQKNQLLRVSIIFLIPNSMFISIPFFFFSEIPERTKFNIPIDGFHTTLIYCKLGSYLNGGIFWILFIWLYYFSFQLS